MKYVISDIHGMWDKYQSMLQRIGFSAEDELYILGDVIDRGADGIKILLDMAARPNVIALKGNHEDMAIRALPCILRTIMCPENEAVLTEEEVDAIEVWFHNGGELSLADFLCLDSEQAQTVWDYLLSMPLYREIEVGNQKFVLLHGGLENFSPDRALEDYSPDEILWCRPEPDTVYYSDKYVVIGHTPTQRMYADAGIPIFEGKIFRSDSFIDIDCGCVYRGGRLGCFCLDTMSEFYV